MMSLGVTDRVRDKLNKYLTGLQSIETHLSEIKKAEGVIRNLVNDTRAVLTDKTGTDEMVEFSIDGVLYRIAESKMEEQHTKVMIL